MGGDAAATFSRSGHMIDTVRCCGWGKYCHMCGCGCIVVVLLLLLLLLLMLLLLLLPLLLLLLPTMFPSVTFKVP